MAHMVKHGRGRGQPDPGTEHFQALSVSSHFLSQAPALGKLQLQIMIPRLQVHDHS